MGYQKEAIRNLAEKIQAEGFRVFIAQSGTHGFFTDAAGARVVCFEWELSSIRFSGRYITNNPKSTGDGWGICDCTEENFRQVFDAYPPYWAVGISAWKFATLKRHIKRYQNSSLYKLLRKAKGE